MSILSPSATETRRKRMSKLNLKIKELDDLLKPMTSFFYLPSTDRSLLSLKLIKDSSMLNKHNCNEPITRVEKLRKRIEKLKKRLLTLRKTFFLDESCCSWAGTVDSNDSTPSKYGTTKLSWPLFALLEENEQLGVKMKPKERNPSKKLALHSSYQSVPLKRVWLTIFVILAK